MVKTRILKDGYKYIFFMLITTLSFYTPFGIYWSILPAVLTLFFTFFFRNPKRQIPADETLVLSPADGRVMSVVEVYDEQFLNAAGFKITIFLSVFDVHVNRSPIAGEIKYKCYTCGRFIPAYNKLAAWENERLTIGIENKEIKVLVTQVAGILARRIVSWVGLGASMK